VAGLIAQKIQAPRRGAWNFDLGEGVNTRHVFECVRADVYRAAS
jgi:hypothetical protein